MALYVFNTLTRKKELFVPIDPPVVRIYTCGLTVYNPMHIGHARTYCFWDVFRRYLEYQGYTVVNVINYTDIDDRILATTSDSLGPCDLAEGVIASFRRDCRSLHIKDYAVYTRATDFIPGQIEMTRQLLAAGHAYVVDGEVFYDVTSFPGYGKLSGRRLEEQLAGASGRISEDLGRKRHPADFTLWKPSHPGEPSWQTGEQAWPSGRPGWHLECSVMSSATLGATFDVHGGAIDNLFPHHENELAQSEPLCGAERWVRYWMHPEHLDLAGTKMSKSLGNVIGVPGLVSEHGYEAVRWLFAMTHYRSKLAFSDELVASAAEGLQRLLRLVGVLEEKLKPVTGEQLQGSIGATYPSLRDAGEQQPRLRHRLTSGRFGQLTERLLSRYGEAMNDDLNCPRATAALFDYAGEVYSAGIEQLAPGEEAGSVLAVYQALTLHLAVLGIELPDQRLFPELAADCLPATGGDESAAPLRAVIDRLLELRQEARAAKDFGRSDLIRDLLSEAGVVVEDTPHGPRWQVES